MGTRRLGITNACIPAIKYECKIMAEVRRLIAATGTLSLMASWDIGNTAKHPIGIAYIIFLCPQFHFSNTDLSSLFFSLWCPASILLM